MLIELSGKKSEALHSGLKSVENIHTNYPSYDWVQIFTDGSADRDKRIAGSSMVNDRCEEAIPLGKVANNLEVEEIVFLANGTKECGLPNRFTGGYQSVHFKRPQQVKKCIPPPGGGIIRMCS